MCAYRRLSPGSALSLHALPRTTSLPVAVGGALALLCTFTVSVALCPCAPALCHSCSFLLRSYTPSFVSYRASFLSVIRCLGTQCRCMGYVLILIARFASPGCHLTLRGDTSWWNAPGAVSSIPFSAARLGGWLLARLHASGVWDESQVVSFYGTRDTKLETIARTNIFIMSLQSAAAAVPCGGIAILTLFVIQHCHFTDRSESVQSLVRAAKCTIATATVFLNDATDRWLLTGS
jgi:hypothetical protein